MNDGPDIFSGEAKGLIIPWQPDVHDRHVSDWSGHRDCNGTPAAIAFPRTTAEVVAIVRTCTASNTAIVPQGGLTGMAGGAVPLRGSLALSLERMTAIEELNRPGSYIVVQAGVPLQRVQEAADEAGLLFPLDLGARGSALIGGNLATNAGGNRVLRYGMARELTLGLEVVIAGGVVLDAMSRMTKDNAGYDLKQLFIGSEGTLGVITRAVLRLFPKPTTQNVALCALEDYEAVLALLNLARDRLGSELSAFEVMWDKFFKVATTGNARRIGFSDTYRFAVLVETMGRDAAHDGERFQGFIEQAFEAGLLGDALLSQNSRDVADFWAVRDASGELTLRFGRTVNFDVSAPVDRLDEFARECCARLERAVPATRVLVFGHIADGNIHFACLDNEGLDKRRIEEVVYETVGEWGGSITAEHGVGLEKRDFLHYCRSPASLHLMRTMKCAIDPGNLFNPGKVL